MIIKDYPRKIANENGIIQQISRVSKSSDFEFLMNSIQSTRLHYLSNSVLCMKKKNRWALQKFRKLKTATKKTDEIIKRLTKV